MRWRYALISALLLAPAAHAQESASKSTPIIPAPTTPVRGPGGLGTADAAWVQQAERRVGFEIEAAKLADKQAKSDSLRQVAGVILNDSLRSEQGLKEIARRNEVLLPDKLGPKERAALDNLKSLKGQAFDAELTKYLRAVNKKDLAADQKEAAVVHDKALSSFIHQQKKQDEQHASELKGLAPAGQPATQTAKQKA